MNNYKHPLLLPIKLRTNSKVLYNTNTKILESKINLYNNLWKVILMDVVIPPLCPTM